MLTKQLNAEIYQCKVGIQQIEAEEDSLKEKIITLKTVLDAETLKFESMKGEQEDSLGSFLQSIVEKYQNADESHSNF